MLDYRKGKSTMTEQEACIAVAQDWRDLARAIRKEDRYASHVSEATKDAEMNAMLARADEIERGVIRSFTIAQRVHHKMTGECVPLLPNKE